MSQKSIHNEEEAGLTIAAIIFQEFLQEPPDMELREALRAWIEEHPEAGEVLGELGDTAVLADRIEDYERLVNSRQRLYSKLRATTRPRTYYLAGGIAASLVIIASVFVFKYSSPKQPVRAAIIRDLAPGTNKAVLTLADGKAIILDSAHSGITLEQGQTITTGRGGQYHLVLSDGTKVWLDAASSLKYPTVFSGATREVVLTGEGFFQVMHHPEPFIVHTRGADIRDLGTAFNINAYPDEEGVKTTLLEGRVEISPESGVPQGRIILRPAQQARILPGGVCQVTDDVDTAEAIAWKEGMFQFNGVAFSTVLRYLSRWYDVRVIDQTGLAGQHVFIALSRNSPLSAFMHLLELTHKLNYQITDSGKTLVITP